MSSYFSLLKKVRTVSKKHLKFYLTLDRCPHQFVLSVCVMQEYTGQKLEWTKGFDGLASVGQLF